jgi:hypothetical protein
MDKSRNVTGLVIGVILIAIGILSLFGRFLTFMSWDNAWPLIIVGIGAAFFIGMALGGKTTGGLAVPGSIIITVGLILLYMNTTNYWEAWAYAWALIICGVGVGVLINGFWSDSPDLRKRGLETIRAGLFLFLIFGVIMEFIFSVTGVSARGNLLLWSVLLVILGLSLLVARLVQVGKGSGEPVDLFWPITMIGVGLIASLMYLNWLPQENLWAVINLWPALLIVAGLGIILRGRTPWLGAVLAVLLVAVIFVAAFAGTQLGFRSTPNLPFDLGTIQFGDSSGERITGSGKVISEDRPVSGIGRVSMTIPGNLEIQQGASEALTVSGEDNILAFLSTDMRGDELLIRWKSNANVRPLRPLLIKLTVKDLQGLVSSSSGKVTVGSLTTGDFRLTLSSSGDVEMDALQADNVSVNLSSSGDILIKGGANRLDLQLTSSGAFQGGDFQVQQAGVRVSSSGNATLWVINDLNVNITSSGNVAYYGTPAVIQTITSSGNLIPRGNK